MYNAELKSTGLEQTQFTLLMALDLTGETTQGKLGRLLALDSTSLTRMLRLLIEHGWVAERAGDDRRQRLLRLTRAGKAKLEQCRPNWERAQANLKKRLGELGWRGMGKVLSEIVDAVAGT